MESRGLDFEGLAEALLGHARDLLPEWLPGGKLYGKEYKCGSLRGEKGQSLSVNVDSGVWADFATDERGGDLIALFAAVEGIGQGEAAKRLADRIGYTLGARQLQAGREPPRQPEAEATTPPPPDAPPPPLVHRAYGEPTLSWCYRDAEGRPLFYVARYDSPNAAKAFFPWSWSPVSKRFVQKGLPAPRPLYGLELLAQHESKSVLIVEGEKAADAARQIARSGYVVVTWPNGSKAVDKADWTPIYGRKVLIWPDADEPGVDASNKIARILYQHCPEVKVIDPSDKADGWDAADALAEGWDWARFREWAKPKVHLFTMPEPVTAVAVVEAPAEAEEGQVSVPLIEAELPHKAHNGKPLSTIENLTAVLKHLGVVVRYNVISKEEELLIPREQFSIDNKANASLTWVMSWCAKVRMPMTNVADYITYIADQHLHNPVANWMLSKPWDGVSRLEDLYATIKAKDEDTDPLTANLKRTLIRRWLISAVAAAFRPQGVSAHGVLVLQGDQYLGKTAWFKRLVSPELSNVIADGMMLRPDDRDSIKQIVSFWLVELGELDATFRKSDIAQLKSFLTRDKDVFRRAYARKESEFARRTVFFASVNPKQFLHDTTGNRRFWTIECVQINHKHEIDMQQLWAEVHTLYQAGDSWYLTHEEVTALNTHNESFMSLDAVEERIVTALDWEADKFSWSWQTATDTLIGLGIERPNQGEVKKASQSLYNHNGGCRKKSNGIMKLFVPPRRDIHAALM